MPVLQVSAAIVLGMLKRFIPAWGILAFAVPNLALIVPFYLVDYSSDYGSTSVKV